MPLSDQVASSNVARHYDELDGVYQVVCGDALHHGLWRPGGGGLDAAMAALEREVVAAVRRAVGGAGRVVDVGCGNGGLLGRMARVVGCEVVGVTVSRVQAQRAAMRGVGLVVCGDWLELAAGLGRFDALVEVEVLGHLVSARAFFDQAASSLHAGGVVVMADYLATTEGWSNGRGTLERLCTHGRLSGLATRDQVVAAAAAAGFCLEEDCDWSLQAAPTWKVLQRRLWLRGWWSVRVWRAVARVRRWSDLRLGALGGMRLGYRRGWLEYRLMVFRLRP